MQTVVGIFTSRAAAERAAQPLCSLGISREHINFLCPGAYPTELAQVPTSDTEQPGTGPALGGLVGGALGASGGLMSAVVSTLVPGIGPVMAARLTALGLLGLIGGTVAGAVAGGGAVEDAMAEGLPKDELFVYENALKQGRTVLMVLTEDDTQAEAARAVLAQEGAENLDTARDRWWVGLRAAEAAAYAAHGGDFVQDEAVYRRGFAAALSPPLSGKPQ